MNSETHYKNQNKERLSKASIEELKNFVLSVFHRRDFREKALNELIKRIKTN